MDKLIKKLSKYEEKTPIKLTKWSREIMFDFITKQMEEYKENLVFKESW